MRRHLGWVLGLALVVVGVLVQGHSSQDVGWFAYAGDVDFGNAVLLTRQDMIGIAVTTLGLVVLAGWLGFVLGRRKRPTDQGSDT